MKIFILISSFFFVTTAFANPHGSASKIKAVADQAVTDILQENENIISVSFKQTVGQTGEVYEIRALDAKGICFKQSANVFVVPQVGNILVSFLRRPRVTCD